MSYRYASRKSAVAKAFTALQSRTVRKITSLHRLAPLHLDEPNAQNGCVPAPCQQLIFFAEQSPRRRPARSGQQARASFFRHRLAPHVAALPSKRGVGSWPRRESAHAVVNL